MDENKFWLAVVFVITVSTISLIGSLTFRNMSNTEKMASMGYCQTTLMGNGQLTWAKCGEAK